MKTILLTSADSVKKAKDLLKFSLRQAVTACFLLNESLATTNVAEGLYIARDVVKSMRYLGTRAIFNTHMHDLARNLDEVNTTVKGDSKIESLVTGVENGQRSFKVFIAPPQGVSYAKDIAEKYGVTFDKIKKQIDRQRADSGVSP